MNLAQVIGDWWWLVFFIPFGGAGEALRRWSRNRHERKLELIRARGEATAARLPVVTEKPWTQPPQPVPGPCPHRPWNVKPVFSALGDHSAYLCAACDAQLPKEWAVMEEDL